jgi:hypothetical protein
VMNRVWGFLPFAVANSELNRRPCRQLPIQRHWGEACASAPKRSIIPA